MVSGAIILSGGFGTRLRDVVSDLPKTLAPVNGRPFLDYILKYVAYYDISAVTLAVGYMSDKIITQYGEKYNYSVETEPLGTGGAIRRALATCDAKEVLVLNGDSFFDIDIRAFYQRHAEAQADCSLALRTVENAARYGTVLTETGGRIRTFKEKDGKVKPGTINGGVYLINKQKFMENTPAEKPFSVEKDFFETKLHMLNLCGFVYEDYFIDIGIVQDYEKAQHDFKGFKY